jgi:predicted RND superfamily exporter protein
MTTNLMPVLTLLGFMGLVGIHLDVATSIIAAIVLGITIDDTVHFAYYYHYSSGTRSKYKRLKSTLHKVGQAIFLTSIILVAGFGTMLLGSAKTTTYFGGLLALAIISAFFAFIYLLPTLLIMIDRIRRSRSSK